MADMGKKYKIVQKNKRIQSHEDIITERGGKSKISSRADSIIKEFRNKFATMTYADREEYLKKYGFDFGTSDEINYNKQHTEKGMEKIGYIKKDKVTCLNGINLRDGDLRELEIEYDYRDLVEERSDVVQPICAGVVMTKDNKILVINKSSKSTGKISPEKDKTLLYIGGHLDISDQTKTNLSTFLSGMKREILEEMNIKISDEDVGEPIVTYTPTSEKSAKHMGIIFPIILSHTFNTGFTDGKCRFVDIGSLNEINNFESWSEIILEEIVKKRFSKENAM